jgi:hypothetical protein
MKRYTFYSRITGDTYIEINAKSEEEAWEMMRKTSPSEWSDPNDGELDDFYTDLMDIEELDDED